MRILANENVAGAVIRELRTRGYDVLSVKESMRGEKDRVVLARAHADGRLVLTCDEDFGELAVRSGLPAESGVILLRLSGSTPEIDTARVIAAVTSRDDWGGHFAVVSDDRVRLRPLSITTRR